ncbi:hypothetical protein F5146DRAFT_1129132 [Armillaria mellea]|nr:hypothetical protein F5146DRAFT_1129132 [Armillaria mellea]
MDQPLLDRTAGLMASLSLLAPPSYLAKTGTVIIEQSPSSPKRTTFATIVAASASKEGGEHGIAIDDDDIIDVIAEKRLLWQLDLWILLAFALSFTLGGLATNLGNAIILNSDTGDSFLQVLHMSTHQFYAVAVASYLTIMLLQVPSNYMLKYFSPSCWLAFLMLGWGVTLMVIVTFQNYITVLLLCLLLSAFEAGLVPGVVYFTTFMASYIPPLSLGLFMPTIISGLGYQGCDAQLFVVPPSAASFVAMVGLSVVADKYWVGSMCCLISYAMAGTTFIVQGTLPPMAFTVCYVLLCFGTMFSMMPLGLILAWFTSNLRDTNTTTLAIAFNSTFIIAGRVIGVFLYKLSEAPGYRTGHYTNGGLLFFCAACIQLLWMIYKWRNKKLQIGQNPWIV